MNIRNVMVSIGLALSLCACGGGSDTPSPAVGVTPPVPVTASYHLSGQVQKGPFAVGSSVVANELDAALNPTGKVYSTQTSDDLGNFSISGSIGTNLVEIVGDGFFMDELTGNLAGARIQLRAVADLSVNTTPTINVLTSLQAPRLRQLMAQGMGYAAANAQSQNEVLGAFGVVPSTVTGLTNLSAMKINGTGDADAVLLAASVTLSKMAANAAAANSSSVSAELSNFINTIASQLAAPGVVAPSGIYQARVAAVTQLDFTAIRRNVETYYAKRGVIMTAPKFEEWIDKSSGGTLPQRQVPIPGLSFAPVTWAEAGQLVTSNTITMAGLGNGVSVPVAVSSGTTIIKNNIAVSGLFAQVQNGDTLAFRVLTAGYGYISTSTISIGTTSTAWTVSSAPLHGTINGLVANSLTLQVNGGGNITMVPGAREFFFSSALANGTSYSVTIATQPTGPRQVCSVSGGTGVVGSGAANVVINCYADGAGALSSASTVPASGIQHSKLTQPVVVLALDNIGNPLVGASVVFSGVDGTGYITPQTVLTGAGGIASWSGYVHTVGQQIKATTGNLAPVVIAVNVTPTNHPYDGAYVCRAVDNSPFSMVINNGVIIGPQSLIFAFYQMTGTINEATGVITAAWPAIFRTTNFQLTGQLQTDASGRVSATGVASNFYTPNEALTGPWSCDRQ